MSKQEKEEKWTLSGMLLRHSGVCIILSNQREKHFFLLFSDTVAVREEYMLTLLDEAYTTLFSTINFLSLFCMFLFFQPSIFLK